MMKRQNTVSARNWPICIKVKRFKNFITLFNFNLVPDFPSPSAYNDNRGKFGRNNDGILVSMSGWETGPIIEGPSPGNYNIKSEIGESNPKYSFGSKQSKLCNKIITTLCKLATLF